MKKAAMFGLDARIALSIFGALSVITGAALYSAIEKSKTIALIVDFQELGKAWEAYYLDMGNNLPHYISDSNDYRYYRLKNKYLVDKPLDSKNWKGPYSKYISKSYYQSHPDYYNIHIVMLTDETNWGGENNGWYEGNQGICATGKTCYIWVNINGFDTERMALSIDKIIDNSDGDNKGSFRWFKDTSSPTSGFRLFFKYMAIANPNK